VEGIKKKSIPSNRHHDICQVCYGPTGNGIKFEQMKDDLDKEKGRELPRSRVLP
jgi:hypothetical protein